MHHRRRLQPATDFSCLQCDRGVYALAPGNAAVEIDPNVYKVVYADRTLFENAREYLDAMHVLDAKEKVEGDSYLKTIRILSGILFNKEVRILADFRDGCESGLFQHKFSTSEICR